jgi:hypothetical protein
MTINAIAGPPEAIDHVRGPAPIHLAFAASSYEQIAG